MRPPRRWRRARNRGIAEIIAAILLVALTLIAGVILWTFHVSTPASPPSVSFVIRSGGSNPVWGDPTDCQPWGYTIADYPSMFTGSTQARDNLTAWERVWDDQCEDTVTGNFSTLNSTQIIISAHTPSYIPLSEIDLTFVCNNASNKGGETILVNGSLASMTWFPGVSSEPANGAPLLGYCGNFDANYGGAAYDTYYNRLGIFVPLQQGVTGIENGDTFILYIHNGGWPIDFECVANAAGVIFDDQNSTNGCHYTYSNPQPVIQNDYDDYHGAPPWCFTSEGACTIYLTYTGSPSTVLATIPVYSLAPPTV